MIIRTEEEMFRYTEKILGLLEEDEELCKLSPEEQCLALAAVIYAIGFSWGKVAE